LRAKSGYVPVMTKPGNPAPGRRYAIGAAMFDADRLAPGLHVVATPIGNLGDMTVRGLATLAAADTILCEDTRTTAKLLARYAIRNRLEAYHEHNAERVRPQIVRRLAEGAAIALVSDAGMPLVSDPGYRLVEAALAEGVVVTCSPGPSAVLTALALSGLPTDRFAFLGFMPHKTGERGRLLAEVASLRSTLIFFESPHRIVETLAHIAEALPGRAVVVARELTKLHEEVLRGSAGEIAALLASREAVKGEITLLVGPPDDASLAASEADIEAAIDEALKARPATRVAADLAREFGLNRKDVYARILARRGNG
jgi:16S rRNA (cytidine1402-2'-O)-methyltransferase